MFYLYLINLLKIEKRTLSLFQCIWGRSFTSRGFRWGPEGYFGFRNEKKMLKWDVVVAGWNLYRVRDS